jgi:flavin-dependent dehydrogenase
VKLKIGIIGCSITGAYLAWKLSRDNEVTVFERKKSIGGKPCSGLISSRIWNFIPKNDKLVENKIDDAILHFSKKNVRLKFHPRMAVLDRDLLDRYVAGLASQAGARIILGSEVKRIFHVKGHKPQIQADKIYEFDYVIGCDGSNSMVRKSMGIKDPKFKLGIYTHVKKKNASNFVDVYPSKSGFGWIIPRGTKVEYGFVEDIDLAKANFEKFCRARKAKVGDIFSHVIAQGLCVSNNDRIVLCGDAAGLTKPTSSGGIIWALTAADMLVRDFPNLKKYNNDVRRFFEPKFLFTDIENSIVRFLGKRAPSLLPKEAYMDSDLIY